MQLNGDLVTSMIKQFKDSKIVTKLPEWKFALTHKYTASDLSSGCKTYNMHDSYKKKTHSTFKKCKSVYLYMILLKNMY